MLRPQEIPTLVNEGLYDVGITGKDWVGETKSDVEPILDLEYGKIRLVIAFPDNYRYKNLDAMIADYAKKKKTLRLSSEYLTTASRFIKNASLTKNILEIKIHKLLLLGYVLELTNQFRFIYHLVLQKQNLQKM